MRSTVTHRPVPFYRGVAEVAFGVTGIRADGPEVIGSMRPTPSLADRGAGMIHQGALGVLIDDISAYAALTGRHAAQWGVSSVISVDFHAPVQKDFAGLTARASFVTRTGDWGFARGEVTGNTGVLIATMEQRMRYLPGDSSPHEQPWAEETAGQHLPLLDQLLVDVHSESRRAEFRLTASPLMSNPLGTLHGGIGLCIAEVAARRAWTAMMDDPASSFHTSNIRVTYLRPGRLGGDLAVTVAVNHASRSFAVVEVSIRNPDGMPIIAAQATLHRSGSESNW